MAAITIALTYNNGHSNRDLMAAITIALTYNNGHSNRDMIADDDELMLNVLRCHLTY